MTDTEKVDRYLKKHQQWSEQLAVLRRIFQKTELLEEIKWGAPSYSLDGKLVAGLGAFKNHYAIWFHQGVFLKDIQKRLLNAQDGKTKAMRQWRFEKNDVIDDSLVLSYIQEAIANCKAGKEVKIERKKGVDIPPALKEAFKNHPTLQKDFKQLTPGKQREYAAYISEAKREATKQSRITKIAPMIEQGVGLHDKYKNC